MSISTTKCITINETIYTTFFNSLEPTIIYTNRATNSSALLLSNGPTFNNSYTATDISTVRTSHRKTFCFPLLSANFSTIWTTHRGTNYTTFSSTYGATIIIAIFSTITSADFFADW